MLDDHLACPSLKRWLPGLLGEHAHAWIAPDARPSRGLARVLSGWPPVPDDASALEALVVATRLRPSTGQQIPASLLERVRIGAPIVDLALVDGPTITTIWRPARRRRSAMLAVAERAAHWTGRGLVDVEQWASLDPGATVVTLGVRGAHMR